MEFCPKCDNFLAVKKKKVDGKVTEKSLLCQSCGYTKSFTKNEKSSYTISTRINHDGKDKTVVLQTAATRARLTEEDRDANEWLFESEDS